MTAVIFLSYRTDWAMMRNEIGILCCLLVKSKALAIWKRWCYWWLTLRQMQLQFHAPGCWWLSEYYVWVCSRIHPAARPRGWRMGFFLWIEDSTFFIADLCGKSYILDHVITEAVSLPRQLWFISLLSEWRNWSLIDIRGNGAEGAANSPIAMDRVDPKKYAQGPRFVVFVVLVTVIMPLVMAVVYATS